MAHDFSGAAIKKQPFGVLFVCTGNICRSPLAKFVFLDLIEKGGVSQMFSSRAIKQRVMAKIGDDLNVEMKRAVDMILARRA